MSDHSRRWWSAQRDSENRSATRSRAAAPSLAARAGSSISRSHGRAQRSDVPGSDEHSAVGVERFGNPAHVRRDAGQTHRHGLKEGERQVLVQ